jgi:hypothetical protein
LNPYRKFSRDVDSMPTARKSPRRKIWVTLQAGSAVVTPIILGGDCGRLRGSVHIDEDHNGVVGAAETVGQIY